MKFEEMPLNVPKVEKVKKKLEELTSKLENATCKEDAIKVVNNYFKFTDKFETDVTVISIRNSIDTNDKVYDDAMNYCDEVLPIISSYDQAFKKVLMQSKFLDDLKAKFGELYFKRIEVEFKCFDEKIIPEMQQENKLVSEYSKIIANTKMEYNGETYSLTQFNKFLTDKDRKVREEAAHIYYNALQANDKRVGEIYDELVKLRDSMAKKLGFKNYVELGYLRLGRLDYDAEMVANYRKQIEEVVVPVVKKLRKRQAERLNISKPMFYDYALSYLSGNAKPCGDSKYLVECARKMYHEMSDESGKFFDFMVENNLMDLDAKPGKMAGGYMTYMPAYKSPFIFANSNGTSGDVDTLTHEVGHAFQGYLGSSIKVPSYRMPTLEACEIDSMSMEFFAWPWMELFFEDQADKYRFSHLDGAISFLPYGVEVDEFQHFVYENPNATHEDRCNKWKELEKKYRPWQNYKGFKFLEDGKYRERQSHIFGSPFYYIDYTLAQVLALQFKCEMDKNRAKARSKYIKLLKMGGKYPFLTLIEKAHLRNPFISGNVKKVIKPQVKVLDSFDDKSF